MSLGEFSGRRFMNKKLVDPINYNRIMSVQGYVPQQDVFLESLTVWQSLTYCALLRSKANLSMEAKFQRAASVMTEMGLDMVSNNFLGTQSDSKGISGGQRRRLSVAQALLGDPLAILLDEPTSGLDASTSLELLKILNNMKRQNKTSIALTIHQPRAEAFDMFDNLILLSHEGRLVYSGPASGAVAVISQATRIQRNISDYENPGDFIIDVLGVKSEDNHDENGGTSSYHNQSNGIFSPSQISKKLIKATKRAVSKVFDQNKTFSGDDRLGDYEMVAFDEPPNSTAPKTPLQADDITDTSQSTYDDENPSPCVGSNTTEFISRDQRLLLTQELRDVYTKSDHFKLLVDKYKEQKPVPLISPSKTFLSRLCCIILGSSSPTMTQDIFPNADQSRTPIFTQVWILFARRLDAQWPTLRQLTIFTLQLLLIGYVTCYTFSYEVSTSLELPYQVRLLCL